MEPVVVVGGGIVGVSVAHHLRDAGEVAVVEKGALGSGTTARSIANFAWLQPHPSELAHELRERAWREYAPLIEAGDIGFRRTGAMHVAETPEGMAELESDAEHLRSFGLDVDVLAPDDLPAHNVAPTGTEGAIYADRVGHLDPHEVIQHWASEAREAGVEFHTGVEATDVRVEDGRVRGVETDAGVLDAGTVVNAAGPWAPRVNEMAGVSMPLRHTPGRILVLGREEPFSLPYVRFENGDYFREEGDSQALAGRLEKAYGEADLVDPDREASVEESFYRDVARSVEQRVPILDGAEVVNEWVGWRTVTPDAGPILGPTPVEGFVAACGMSGLGITYAPAVGDLLAEYVRTGDRPPVLDHLGLDRF